MLLQAQVEKNPKNDEGFTPLHIAAHHGYSEVCRILLENNAEKNPKGDDGITPLHIAALFGHLDICKALIQSGAERFPRNNNGKTPLDFASTDLSKPEVAEVASFLRNLRKRPFA